MPPQRSPQQKATTSPSKKASKSSTRLKAMKSTSNTVNRSNIANVLQTETGFKDVRTLSEKAKLVNWVFTYNLCLQVNRLGSFIQTKR